MKNVTTFGKLLLLLCPSSFFLLTCIKTTTRNELARLGMGNIFLVMEHARLISIAQKVIHTFGKDRQLTLCCAFTVYSRARSITLKPGQSARSIRGRELNKGAE